MLTFRKYIPEDKDQCIELLQKGHDPKFNAARFDWLHHNNLRAPSDIALAMDGDNVAGFYGALKKTVIIREDRYVIARDIDPVVSPDYRGQGIFSGLLEFALETFTEIDFFYNFANQASTRGFVKKGWRQIGPLRDYVCQTGYDSLLSKQCLLYLGSYARSAKRVREDIREISFKELEAYTTLNPTPPKEKIWVERSIPFLRWRYVLNPLHTYDLFAQYVDNRVLKLCVIRFLLEKNQLLVLDVVPFEDEDYGLEAFLPFWAHRYRNAAIYLWNAMPKTTLKYFLTNPTKRRVGQNFLVRKFPGKEVPDFIFDLNRWFISRGDSEVF